MTDEKRQAIMDALEALSVRRMAAYQAAVAKIAQERQRIQAQCGEIGHIFGRRQGVVLDTRRGCVVCGADDPARRSVAEEVEEITQAQEAAQIRLPRGGAR